MEGNLRYLDEDRKLQIDNIWKNGIVSSQIISSPSKDSDVSAADPSDILKNMKVRHSLEIQTQRSPL